MTILVLWREENLVRELAAYARAFRRRGARLICLEPGYTSNGDLRQLLGRCPERPAFILHPESDPVLPWGLTTVDIPTVCFQVDTFAYTRRRIAWSMLFDHVIVWHPAYVSRFQLAGHAQCLLLAHAIEPSLFLSGQEERAFDIGWVGQTSGRLYRTRRRLLPILARSFKMNDWDRPYSQLEMADVYCRSKIAVNIGRDDYPQDANLRVFEAMAAGALLLTSLPSELSQLGFEEGIHFVGYRGPSQIREIARRILNDELVRREIAEAGKEKVLREHTYDCRVEMLFERLAQAQGKFFAPARQWPEERVRLAYLDYFASNGASHCALLELQAIAQRSLGCTARAAVLLARSWLRKRWQLFQL